MGRFIADAGVKLYYNNSLKFETTSTGATLSDALIGTSAHFTGNVEVGSNADISMDSSANGQLMIDGLGYQGAIALDDTAMHIYHNSSSRSLILGTNETARLTIDGSGNSTFAGSVILGASSNGNAVNKLTIASGTNGDGIFLTGLGTSAGMATGNYKAIDFQYSNTDASFQSAIRFVVADDTLHGGQMEFWTDNSSGTNTKALTLDKSQNSTFAGVIHTNKNGGAVAAISTPRIRLRTDGVIEWGPTYNRGTLTWDTGKAIISAQSGYVLELNANNSTLGLSIATSGDITIPGAVLAGELSAASIGVSGSNGTDGKGISLYNGAASSEPTYGMMFQQTSSFGTHGYVTQDWATYFTMNSSSGRGWIFRKVGVGNVASINNDGNAHFQTPCKITSNDTSLTFEDAGTNAMLIKVGAGDELYIGSNNTYQFRGNSTGQAFLNSSGYVSVTAGASNYTGFDMFQRDGSRVGYFYGDGGAGSTPSIGILDSDGNWAIRASRDSYVEFRVNNIIKLQTTTSINYNYQPTWIEGGSADWNETTPGRATGSLHLDPGSGTNNFGSAITFGASDANSGTNAQAGIYTRSDGAYGTKMYFATSGSYAAGSKTQMMIDYTGYIGMGTLATTGQRLTLAQADSNGSHLKMNNSRSGGGFWISGVGDTNSNSSIVSPGGLFWYNGSTKMLLNSSGNLGISTVEPEGKLDVTGDIWLNSDNANSAYYLRINRGQSQDGGILLYGNKTLDWQIVNQTSRNLNWYSYTVGRSVMRLTNSGQLLVNATSSTYGAANGYNLGVKGTTSQSYISIARFNQNLDSQGVIIGLDTNHSYFVNRDALPLEFHTNNDVRMHIHGSLNRVGIGGDPVSTAGVNNFLMVKGSSHSGIVLQDTDGGAVHEMWNDGGTLNMWDSSVGYRIRFYVSGDAQAYNGWAADSIGISGSNGTDGKGISLYNGSTGGEPTYGMMFMQTSNFGTYGSVSSDWATYFTMNNNASRGWIFRRVGVGNFASISAGGDFSLDGSVVFPTTNQRIKGLNGTYLQIKSGSASDAGINLVDTNGGNLMYFYGSGSEAGILNSGGYWTFRHTQGGHTYLYAGNQSYNWRFQSSNGYAYFPSWINLSSGTGLFTDSNGGHFYGNENSTYGAWRTAGSRNGYSGIYDNHSGTNVNMMDSSGNGGNFHSTGGWHFYYNRSNACLAVGSSTTSSSYSLYVTGSIYSTADVIAYSDKRAKENIVTVDSAIEKVNKLRGVYYTPKKGEDKSRKVGVIAQEILEVLPEVVTHDKENDRYGVDYGKITGLLIEAIKDQQKQIDKLTKFVDKLNK